MVLSNSKQTKTMIVFSSVVAISKYKKGRNRKLLATVYSEKLS